MKGSAGQMMRNIVNQNASFFSSWIASKERVLKTFADGTAEQLRDRTRSAVVREMENFIDIYFADEKGDMYAVLGTPRTTTRKATIRGSATGISRPRPTRA